MRQTLLPLGLLLAFGCAAQPTALDVANEETGLDGPLDAMPDEDGKADADRAGPRGASDTADAVWTIGHQWADVTDEAGLAWDAASGLDYEQKFDAWTASFERVDNATRYGSTFRITTPFGDRAFDAPTLECAEVALLLRVTFAAWHGLPFYVQGWDAHTRQTIYAGHFGFVDRNGGRLARFRDFRRSYADHTGDWNAGDEWPEDARLRGYHLGDDDGVPFIGDDAGAGAYFDEIHLNKRVGYFSRLLLLYFGSANLADGANMFHIRPDAIAAGDVLLERWQRRGIGHTIPVIQANEIVPGRFEVTVVSGSMPRRQPVWEEPARARASFTLDETGGLGESRDGRAYATLGGGIRRWRTPVLRSGRWYNTVRSADRDAFIADDDVEAIAARPEAFRDVLANVSPEEQLEVAEAQVEDARAHLLRYPASCAARTRREDAYARLETLAAELLALTPEEVTTRYRTLADYVFAELEYSASRTCCWNRSNAAMAEIVLDLAQVEQDEASAAAMCVEPTVFRAEADGYARWRAHAETLGRGAEWRAWSEDESCSQRDVPMDTVSARAVTAYCSVAITPEPVPTPDPTPEPAPADACDPAVADSQSAPVTLEAGSLVARICEGDEDFYVVDDAAMVTITFVHADGDLDLASYDTEGNRVDSSESVSDQEQLMTTGPTVFRVYGYSGATGTYTITVE